MRILGVNCSPSPHLLSLYIWLQSIDTLFCSHLRLACVCVYTVHCSVCTTCWGKMSKCWCKPMVRSNTDATSSVDSALMMPSQCFVHPAAIHPYLQRSLTERVKQRSFNVMVAIALVNLSEVTATIMPFPPSAPCVFKVLRLEKCKGGPNNVHKAPETNWGPTGVSHMHGQTSILTMHSSPTSH